MAAPGKWAGGDEVVQGQVSWAVPRIVHPPPQAVIAVQSVGTSAKTVTEPLAPAAQVASPVEETVTSVEGALFWQAPQFALSGAMVKGAVL